MKKYLYISMACLMGMVSCSKENSVKEIEEPAVEKITFSASIDLGADTKTTLADKVGGKAIQWSAGDVIGVANDQNDDIESCAVTVDALDPTKCSFDVTPVVGATTYYTICKGNSISGITFDHETQTFSGLNVGRKSFGKGSLAASDLAMAGKTTNKSTVSMKPCLALVHLRIAAESVAATYEDGYSGVRGFYFLVKKNDSRKNVSEDYTVNMTGDMIITNGATTEDEKKIEEDGLMTSGTDYYFTIIPVGDIDLMEYRLFGYSDAVTTSSSTAYTMSLNQSLSVDPGDYYDFGTINPVGLKKDKDHPAITLGDGMADWAAIDMYPDDDLKDAFPGDGDRLVEWKATSDLFNVYFYFKAKIAFAKEKGTTGFFATAFDFIDGAGSADGYAGLEGCDVVAKTCPFSNAENAESVTFYNPESPTYDSSIKFSPFSSSASGRAKTAGTQDENYVYVEISLPRNKIGYPPSGVPISVRVTANYTASETQTITLK